MAIRVADVAGPALAKTATFAVTNPATGQLVGTVPDMTSVEVERLAASLRAAQPAWEALGPAKRAKHLINWLNWIMDNDKRILGLVQSARLAGRGEDPLQYVVSHSAGDQFHARLSYPPCPTLTSPAASALRRSRLIKFGGLRRAPLHRRRP